MNATHEEHQLNNSDHLAEVRVLVEAARKQVYQCDMACACGACVCVSRRRFSCGQTRCTIWLP